MKKLFFLFLMLSFVLINTGFSQIVDSVFIQDEAWKSWRKEMPFLKKIKDDTILTRFDSLAQSGGFTISVEGRSTEYEKFSPAFSKIVNYGLAGFRGVEAGAEIKKQFPKSAKYVEILFGKVGPRRGVLVFLRVDKTAEKIEELTGGLQDLEVEVKKQAKVDLTHDKEIQKIKNQLDELEKKKTTHPIQIYAGYTGINFFDSWRDLQGVGGGLKFNLNNSGTAVYFGGGLLPHYDDSAVTDIFAETFLLIPVFKSIFIEAGAYYGQELNRMKYSLEYPLQTYGVKIGTGLSWKKVKLHFGSAVLETDDSFAEIQTRMAGYCSLTFDF